MARTHQGAANSVQTRADLLDAGLRLADELGLQGLSVNAVVTEAARSKGAFFHHFADREAYLVELHRRLHDEMIREIERRTQGIDPGADRLQVVAEVYLDTFLARRGVRAFFLEARREPAIRAEISARNASAAEALAADFGALGWREPLTVARLWTAALAEAGVVEFERGGSDRMARRALAALASGRH